MAIKPYCTFKTDRTFMIPTGFFETKLEALDATGGDPNKVCRVGQNHFIVDYSAGRKILRRWEPTDTKDILSEAEIKSVRDPIAKKEFVLRHITQNTCNDEGFNYRVAGSALHIIHGNLDFVKLEAKRDPRMIEAAKTAASWLMKFDYIDFDEFSYIHELVSRQVTVIRNELTELLLYAVFG